MKLKDKKIIVTGSGSGIGRELTLQLLSKGSNVIGLDINELNLNETKKLANSDRLSTYIVDVSNDDSLNKFKEEYLKKYDIVDCLINNAGIIQPFISFNDLDMNIINRVMNINFYGPMKLTKLFLPELLKRNEANITNISSMGGFFPFPKQTIYGASKSALKLFTEGLYSELLNTNVNVMVVFPGAINTNIAKNSEVNLNTDGSSKYKMLSPHTAASLIIKGIEKNKFKLYVGSDSKIMNLMYKFNDRYAIKLINKKMKF